MLKVEATVDYAGRALRTLMTLPSVERRFSNRGQTIYTTPYLFHTASPNGSKQF